MIYITGDIHNTEDMSNLSSKNMRLCCMEQAVDIHDITHAIVLGDFGLPWSSKGVIYSNLHVERFDKYVSPAGFLFHRSAFKEIMFL